MGLLTDSFKEKLQSSLLSSDPRMSSIRQGMLEKIGPMAGRRPIAPTFGELAAGLVSGKRQGERDYLQDEVAKYQFSKMKAPRFSVHGGPTTGFVSAKETDITNDMGEIIDTKVEFTTIKEAPKTTKYSKILTPNDIKNLNEQGYTLNTDETYEVKFAPGVDVTKPINEIINQATGFQTLGAEKTNIYLPGSIPKDTQELAATAKVGSVAKISEGAKILNDLANTPGATGIKGFLAEKGGGLIGQITPELGDVFTSAIAGADVKDIQAFRTGARKYISSSLETMTGEESGRYTDTERAIAEEALRLTSAGASPAQVYAAVVSLMSAELMASDRFDIIANSDNKNFKPKYDLDNKDDLNIYGNELVGLGILPEDALKILRDLRRQRKIGKFF